MAGEIQLNSTTMATESSGTITLSNVDTATNRTNLGLGSMATQAANSVSITGGSVGGVTLGGDVAMASSGLTVRNITTVAKSSDTAVSNSAALTTFFTPTYTPLFAGSKVLGILTFKGFAYNSAGGEGRKKLHITLSGSGITTIRTNDDEDFNFGIYDYGDSGAFLAFHESITLPLVTTSTTDVITATCALKNSGAATTIQWTVSGNNTLEETFMTWMEYK
jgi:hypothetical protein